MARMADLPETLAAHLKVLPLPSFNDTPFVAGPPLAARRVALISTAGLSRRSDHRFAAGDADYRVLPGNLAGNDLIMSHISVNYDRTGFQEDVNVVFPIDRLRELADARIVGSMADLHYSFMGATSPEDLEPAAKTLAGHLKADDVNAVVLVPV